MSGSPVSLLCIVVISRSCFILDAFTCQQVALHFPTSSQKYKQQPHTNTNHTTPSDTAHTQHTSFLVVFSRIHAKLLIVFGDESFKFLTYQLAHTLCAIRSVRFGASHSILSKLRLQSS